MRSVLTLSVLAAAHGIGTDLFVANSGVPGFPPCFRQPVLAVLNQSHYLAFAEGRYNGGYCSGGADGSNSSIWLRRTVDGGSTWTPASMLFDAPPQPDYLSAVWDARRQRALLFIQTSGGNLVMHSDDAGASFSQPQPVKMAPLPAGYSATPGVAHGIQVQGALCTEPTCGGTAGRLIVAWVCHHAKAAAATDISCVGCFSCLATSDDGGDTWAIEAAAIATPQEGSREASILQLPSASHSGGAPGAVIYVTSRNMGATPGHRWHSVSLDSGSSLALFGADPSLPDVDTKNWTGIVAGAARIGSAVLVSTPMSPTERADLALFKSLDNAQSWGAGRLLVAGPAGYSDLVAINATHGAVLFENGSTEFAAKISFLIVQS